MDRIIISDILIRCIIGVRKEERREKQDVMVSIVLTADLSKAGETDRLEDSIDYSSLKKQVVAMTEESRFHLIEALAERIARICLEHPLVIEVQVRVEKPTALRYARSVGVEITPGTELYFVAFLKVCWPSGMWHDAQVASAAA